jgi:glycosyltransferase involved in cell wall biosynthesis
VTALESVLAQTYDDFELLIADDCSQDKSFEIISAFARRDKRITAWQNQMNLGLFQL